MQLKETEAVVLRALPRREDDLLCDLFTRDRGRIWGLARSARKSKKRFGTSLTPLNILKVHYEEKPRFSFILLKETSLAVPLTRLHGSLERLMTAFYFAEVIREMVPEQSPEPGKFRLLCDALGALDLGQDPQEVRKRYEKGVLKLAGVEPHLRSCLGCRRNADNYFFVYKEGGVFCGDCLPPGVSFEAVKAEETERVLSPFLEYCIGKRLKSSRLCL